jgi:hypothetical protein
MRGARPLHIVSLRHLQKLPSSTFPNDYDAAGYHRRSADRGKSEQRSDLLYYHLLLELLVNRDRVAMTIDCSSYVTEGRLPFTSLARYRLVAVPLSLSFTLSSTICHSSLDAQSLRSRLRDATPTTPTRPSKGLAPALRPLS